MIKKAYQSPEMEIVFLTDADVICASLLSHGTNGDVISDRFRWLDV